MTNIELPQTFFGRVSGKGVGYTRNIDGDYDVMCGRCGGTGYTPFHYVYNGVCFQCNGNKGPLETITAERALKLYTAQVRRAEKKEAKRLAIVAERDARVAHLVISHPEVAEVLEKAYDAYQTGERVNSFLADLARQVFNAEGRTLSLAQIEAVEKMLARKTEQDANAVPVVEGRGHIAGEIVAIKTVENDYGVATKITVADDRGFKVYGTMPKALVDEIIEAAQDAEVIDWHSYAKGLHVNFDATVEASRDDKAFGFFSRPAKGKVG